MKNELSDVELWNSKAQEWHVQVGELGDRNRRLNSDPVLFEMLGSVENLKVLDAGCGTGYLSRLLAQKGANVTAIDYSPQMVEVAKQKALEKNLKIDFYVDSISELKNISDNSIDVIVSNYVLMDAEDLDGAVQSFARVLKPNGRAVVIFGHPCFNAVYDEVASDGSLSCKWNFPYFEKTKVKESWGHFTSHFTYYHRPLSEYWRSFNKRFEILEFDEPVLRGSQANELTDDLKRRIMMRAYSVAFHLKKLT